MHRIANVVAAATILFGLSFAGPALSQYYRNSSDEYARPLPSSCVTNFWDSKYYGWYLFQNNCGQAIHLKFIAQNGTGAFGGSGGSADIPAGRSHNIGQTPEEVNAAGGYVIFVCPEGYVDVAANRGNLSSTNRRFQCKKW
mgnify:CR=1 FL=1